MKTTKARIILNLTTLLAFLSVLFSCDGLRSDTEVYEGIALTKSEEAVRTFRLSSVPERPAFLEEELGTTRKRAALMVTIGFIIMGTICSLSLGAWHDYQLFRMTVFDLFDFVTGQLFLPIVGFLTCIFIGWFVPHKIVRDEFTNYGTLRNVSIFHFYIFLVKFVCPICILFIFLHQLGLL